MVLNKQVTQKEIAEKQKKEEVKKADTSGEKKEGALEKFNLLGSEFFEIIKNRLAFKIKIRNVRIFYEDTESLRKANMQTHNNSGMNNFCWNIALNDIVFNSEDIRDHLDNEGIYFTCNNS